MAPGPYIVLIIGIFIGLFQLYLLLSLVKLFFCTKEKSVKGSPMKYTVIITFILLLTVNTCMNMGNIARIVDSQSMYEIFKLIHYTAILFLFTSVYIFLLIKIHHTFKDSAYSFTNMQFGFHAFLIFIIFTYCAINIINLLILRHDPNTIIIVFAALIITVLVIGNIHLLYTFNHNLFMLILSHRQTITSDINNIELSRQQMNLLNTIRKQSILGSFIIIGLVVFTIIVLIFLGFLKSAFSWDKVREDGGFAITYWILLTIKSIALNCAPLSIYLGFHSNNKWYLRLCGVCDENCKNNCVKMAERRMHDKYVSLNDGL